MTSSPTPNKADAAQTAAAPLGGAHTRAKFGEIGSRYALLGIAVLIFVFFAFTLPGTYATGPNILVMLSSQAIPLLLTLAVLVPLRTGDFDLSVAANMIFCSSLLGILVRNDGMNLGLAIAITLVAGLAIGLLNGLLIVVVGVNAFIITLGAMTVLTGLAFGITKGQVITNLPPELLSLGRTQILGLPAAVWYGWLLAAVLWYVFEWTPFGRHLLFVGGNAEAAKLAGIPVRKTRILAFACSAVLASVAGIVLAAKQGSVDPSVGASFLLPPYAAAFLGTTVIQLGRFNVLGAIIGAYALVVGITGLLLGGSQSWVTDVFNGAALMAAVTFAQLVRRKRVT